MKPDLARFIRSARRAGTLLGCGLTLALVACGGGGDEADATVAPTTCPDPITPRMLASGAGPEASAASAPMEAPAAVGRSDAPQAMPGDATDRGPRPAVQN